MLGSKLLNVGLGKAHMALSSLGMVAPCPVSLTRRFSAETASFENGGGETDAAPPGSRTFTSYAIYKGKSAVAFKPIPPTFKQATFPGSGGYGSGYTGYTFERDGVLLVEFAALAGNQGAQSGFGNRNYDWSKKVTFAMRATELAELTDIDQRPIDPATNHPRPIDLYHDPNKGKNDPNVVKTGKALKLSYDSAGTGYMLSINQTAGQAKTFITVPLTRAEFLVLKHLAAYLIPRMYGFDLLYEGAGATPTNLTM